jgi:hypothetical protein
VLSEDVAATGERFRQLLSLYTKFLAYCSCREIVKLSCCILQPDGGLQQRGEQCFSVSGIRTYLLAVNKIVSIVRSRYQVTTTQEITETE